MEVHFNKVSQFQNHLKDEGELKNLTQYNCSFSSLYQTFACKDIF